MTGIRRKDANFLRYNARRYDRFHKHGLGHRGLLRAVIIKRGLLHNGRVDDRQRWIASEFGSWGSAFLGGLNRDFLGTPKLRYLTTHMKEARK